MRSIAGVLLFIGASYCEIEFNERPRNFSIEFLYFTQAHANGHVLISPFGIWTLMAGISPGAIGNSNTQLRIACHLLKNRNTLIKGYKNLTDTVLAQGNDGVNLLSRNYVFMDHNFTVFPVYRGMLLEDFGAYLKVLDFDDPNSAGIVNTYVEKTSRVSNLLRSDDLIGSNMILVSVVSFKAQWTSPFNKSDTVREPFYNEDNKISGNVNMMFQRGKFVFSNMQILKTFVLELPYGTNGKYSMIVMLPYPSVKIVDMYKNLAKIRFKDIFKRLQDDVVAYGIEDIDIKLPRFRINTNILINKPLMDMGVVDIFQPDLANFHGLTAGNIFVSAIVHSANIDVTETGTAASTITKAPTDTVSVSYFHANRPFVYFIMEKTTSTVILSGIYSKPSVY